jgi:hypothetical protein
VTTYSNQSNAKRAADKMIADGTAPATSYEIRPDADGRFAIAWPAETRQLQLGEQFGELGMLIKRLANHDPWPNPADIDGQKPDVAREFRLSLAQDLKPAIARLIAFRDALRGAKPAGEPRRSKAREADELAANGVMPTKPDVTSHANHYYQRRFDRVAELAAADDWAGVAAYQCTGVNTYAKMVRQYRDRLLAAHRAQQAQAEASVH